MNPPQPAHGLGRKRGAGRGILRPPSGHAHYSRRTRDRAGHEDPRCGAIRCSRDSRAVCRVVPHL